ncbi:MAG: hypothetical protein JOY80_09965, partial [Candidatus Dormibacteraeota bacterium]|nr:hypothetical protein [Candidatus Dormibacteraeota bacterium]
MRPAPRRWQPADVEPLAGYGHVLGRVLAARGHDAASASMFLDASAAHDPLLLPGMRDAVGTIA